MGTQFALAIIQDETRLRVREGSVHWSAADGESTVSAGTEVVFTNGAKDSGTADRSEQQGLGLDRRDDPGLRNRQSTAAGFPGVGGA